MHEILEKIALFKDLNKDQIQRLSMIVKKEVYKKDEKVISSGNHINGIFYVINGHIIMYSFHKEDNERPIVLSIFNEGDYFGEMALLKSEQNVFDFIANEDTAVMSISHSDFNYLLKNDHDLNFTIFKTITQMSEV